MDYKLKGTAVGQRKMRFFFQSGIKEDEGGDSFPCHTFKLNFGLVGNINPNRDKRAQAKSGVDRTKRQ